MLILIVGGLCTASISHAKPLKVLSIVKIVVLQTADTVEQQDDGRHCEPLDNSEVLTAAYSQQSFFGPAVPVWYHEVKAVVYSNLNSSFTHGQNNVPIQPFYHQLLFPFHGFW